MTRRACTSPTGPQSTRRGLTLVELVVALAVTGVVVLLAYAVLRAGRDAEARVAAADTALDALRARRAIADALGALTPADEATGRGFTADAQGARFTAHDGHGGVTRFALANDAAGVALRGDDRTVTRLPGARVVGVAARDRTGAWRDGWDAPASVPVTVRVAFDRGAPLVVRIPPREAP